MTKYQFYDIIYSFFLMREDCFWCEPSMSPISIETETIALIIGDPDRSSVY